MRAGCSGLFSEPCNSNGTRLRCRAAYRPVSPLMNINQRHILTAGQTAECIHSPGDAIKSNLFLGWKIFPLPLSGGGKCFRGNQSRKERLVEKNPRHANSGRADFLGRVTSRSSSLNCQTLMFVNWKPTFPGRLRSKDQGGWNSCLADTWHRSVSKWTQRQIKLAVFIVETLRP